MVNRIRTLNIELRTLELGNSERRDCILLQLPLLIERMKTIRNAVWLYTFAIAMFIFSIFSIGLHLSNIKIAVITIVTIYLFVFALTSVLLGVIYAAKEVLLGYKILKIETANLHYIDD